MKTRAFSRVVRLSLTMLLLAILVPAAPAVLAAPPAQGPEGQFPQPVPDGIQPQAPSATLSWDGVPLPAGMRTLHFSAQSLNYVPAYGVITPYGGGTIGALRWTASGGAGSAAFLYIPEPVDWDDSSPVTMQLYFTPISSGTGNIGFFIRPRSFNPGETHTDASSISSPAVPYAGSRVLKQSFSIPASRFGNKELWAIGIQRSDTFSGDVALLSVGLSYHAHSTSTGAMGFPANAINYNSSYGAITPYGGGTVAGLLWAAGGGAGSAAFLDIPRPSDWDGVSSITMRLYLKSTTASPGYVSMFIRPRAYEPGDAYGDASGIDSGPTYVSGPDVILEQVFTIPAERMGSDSLWVIGIQRGGSSETYSDGVVLLAGGLSYNALSNPTTSLEFAANALNYNPTSGVITQYGGGTVAGLLWNGTGSAAFVNIPRPDDWDGVNAVTLRLYFMPLAAASGNVDFFIRPRGYNAGDTYGDASSLSAAAVSVSTSKVARQSFSIPATRFGSKDLWVVAIQRGGSGETYSGEIILLAAEISYRAVQRVYLPLLLR